tara:strand:+ start:3940 stop:4188 length:249 start_codon:yes stop_codon:yes gene_type:complete
MESKERFIYILDYWVPFPSTEYGGLVTLIAENDQEAFDILAAEEQLDPDNAHIDKLMPNVINATKLKLAEEYKSGIIDVFVT